MTHGVLAVILSLTAILPAGAQSQSPDKVAQLMVDAARNQATWGPQPGWSHAPKAQQDLALKEWDTALKTVGCPDPCLSSLMIPMKTPRLYRGDTFQPAVSSEYASRVKAISKERLGLWRGAAKIVNMSDIDIIWYMVQQDAMFQGVVLKSTVADRQVGRLQSLPPVTVTRWAKVAGVKTCAYSEVCAAFALIQVDPLWNGSAFRPEIFQAALPLFEKMAQDLGFDKP